MESPKTTASAAKIINNDCATAISTTHSSLSSESVGVVKDTPIFSYVSNLSPIKPVQAAPVAQGFPGLNSPPLVFASPQINAQGQSNLSHRPQFKQSSNVELSRQDDTHKDASTNADEKSYGHASVDVKLVTEKKHENDSLGHNQSGSPSGYVDEFLNDFVVMDCSDLTNLANSTPKKSDDKPRTLNGSADLEDSVARFETKDNLTEIPSPAVVEHAAKDAPKIKSSYNMMLKQPDDEKQSSLCTQNICIAPVSCALQRQDYGHLELLAGSLQPASKGCGETIQALSNEPVEKAQVCSKAGKATQAFSTEAVKDITLHDLKASKQHGTSKRCLQFEDGQPTENISCALKPLGISTGLRSPTIKDSEVPGSPGSRSATYSNMQLSNVTQPVLSSLSNGHFGMRVSRPSGIGLHLNSIVNAMPANGSATASLKSGERGGSVSVRGKKSASTMSCDVPKSIRAHSSLEKVAEDVSACTCDGWSESQNLLTGSSATSLSPRSVDNFNPLPFQPIEPQTTPHDKREISSELADNVEEFNLSSPKKKRKKMMETGDDDGFKRCNCKKTKCLKLYCDCFAAGIYCAEPCACQDCFNRPDYEDTVLETRQQIESRNPLAFAPKIVQRINEPLANRCGEEVAKFTPSSARHKRGCNCKKSMCLKKYCECYQANVGCSDGCRCEGCKNVYGRKEEYAMRNERSESSLDGKSELVATGYGSLQPELYSPHNLTPLTPSFPCSDNEKDASKLRFLPGRFLQTPDSDLHFLAPYGKPRCSRDTLNDYDMILQTRKDILEVVSLDDELDCGNSERRDNFTANCHAVGHIGHFSALSNPPSMAIDTRAPLCSGNGQVTSSGSLRWRGSPITPLTRVGGTNISQVLASTDKLYDIIEDEAPKFFKETPTSVNCVKASSPNSKRVSPPNSHLQDVGPSSSAGLRTGRKFILQAVPSFPHLTPCIDSKGSTTQTTIHP